MKKIINVLICFLLSYFLFSVCVSAANVEVSNGESGANSENSITMKIIGTKNTDGNIDLLDYNEIKFDLTLVMDNEEDKDKVKIDKVEIPKEKIETGIVFTSEEIGWKIEKTDGLPEELELNIYYSTKEIIGNFTIKPVNVWLYKDESNSISLSSESIKEGNIKLIIPPSNDATLESLVVKEANTEYNLTPEFDKDITDYTLELEENIGYINIVATPALKASYTGTGRKVLELGKNEYEIKVTAEDKETTKTYKITIFRGKVNVPSGYLSSLKVTTKDLELSPKFDKKNNKYTVDAPFETKKLDLEYITEDNKATVEITGNENFEVGENKVIIKVTANDKSETQEYEIIVNVNEEKSEPAKPLDPIPEDKEKPGILIIGGIILGILLILVLVGILLFKKRKRKKRNKTAVQEEVKKDIKYYEEETTTTYDINSFKESESTEEIEKTKEYHFDFK